VVLLPAPAPYGRMRLSKKAVGESLPLAIAAFLDWLLASGAEIEVSGQRVPIRAGHVCLLFKHLESFGTSQAEPFGLALSARGIPHVLVGGRSFYDRDEISAALAALSAIERPDDTLHVVATLRGLFFGLTDDAIFEWKLRYGRIHPLSPPITALPEPLTGVGDALAILARLHRLRNRRPFAETLRELFDKTRAHVSLALLPNGEQALANVHHLMHLREEGALSFRGFIDTLRERADKRVAGEAPILEEAGDGVRMMTVHRAKGLEFPIVVLADPTARMTGGVDRHIDATRGLGAARIFGLAPWELVENEALEQDRDRAEAVRVGYVAATRARDMLVVPIVGDDPTYPEDGWLAPLHTALAPHLYGAPEQPSTAFATGPLARLAHFADDSVLLRPNGEGPSRKTVAPGVHTTPLGRVVVWDPAVLELDRSAAPRVRGADLIAAHADASTEDQQAFRTYLEKRETRLATQAVPSLKVVTATQAAHGDGEIVGDLAARPVERIVIPRSPDRVGGPRFGDLVHQTLATIELSATPEGIARVVAALARIVGAPEDEARAAEAAVLAATKHPLWLTFMSADERGDLRREVPLACRFAEQILEGVVDVAYLEDGTWTVVDFKTDKPEEDSKVLASYETQVLLYVLAIERATGRPARGALLFL
jgi:ATP-dependent helicase/nuclease subunit A